MVKSCNNAPKWLLLSVCILLFIAIIVYLAVYEIQSKDKPYNAEVLKIHSKMYLRTMILLGSAGIGYVAGYVFFQQKMNVVRPVSL